MPCGANIGNAISDAGPLDCNKGVVSGFDLAFRGNHVVSIGTRRNRRVLGRLIRASRNSRCLNRITLIPFGSPVSRSGLLFCGALFSRGTSGRLTVNDTCTFYVRNNGGVSDRRLTRGNLGRDLARISFVVNSTRVSVSKVARSNGTRPIFEGNS